MRCIFILFVSLFSTFSYMSGSESSSPSKNVSQPVWKEEMQAQKTLKILSKPLSYTVRLGALILPGKAEDDHASISYTSYTMNGGEKNRPILFCFNGGPGSSSVWLHMGFIGPKRVVFPSSITAQNYHATFEENPNTLLASADLVFIDPVATGFSQVGPKTHSKDYFGITEDIDLFARFIERYLSQFQKWNNPKYLLGESYGTIRAVLLAKELHEKYFFDVDGLILISQALDLSLLDGTPFDEGSLIAGFPSIVLAAQTEKLLSEPLQSAGPLELYERAKQFATTELAPALYNPALSPEQISQLAATMSLWTAIPQNRIERSRLRITLGTFRQELFNQKSLLLGRFDTRITTRYPYSDGVSDDPSFSLILNGFTTGINRYFQEELGLNPSSLYVILNPTASLSWNWKSDCALSNFTPILQELFTLMPSLRVYGAAGLFDAATPPFAQEIIFDRIALNRKTQSITFHLFQGGHMMYLDQKNSSMLSEELKGFIK